jgi:2-polyprenyl-6-methoxyphenol hydroxylase-like FAD-dependent oxidoreductase
MDRTSRAADETLVVGAGPVGLFLAVELARHGLRPRVVERHRWASPSSRAVAIQPRTLEIMEAAGVTSRIEARGVRTSRFHLVLGRRHVEGSFDRLDTAHPHVVMLPQHGTERILEDRAQALGVTVHRGVELTGMVPDEDGVAVVTRGADGLERLDRYAWVVGCDGARSQVRRQAGIGWHGGATGHRFTVADVRMSFPGERDETWLTLSEHGLVAVFPLPSGPDAWRVIADRAPEEHVEPTAASVEALLRTRTSFRPARVDATWVASFQVDERVAARFRAGRVLLAGDAAHIHSPVGGQGMNTGLQDAHNLAWKLALVARRAAPDALLDSYSAERRPVAQAVVLDTGQATRLATARGRVPRALRDRVLGYLGGFELVQAPVLRRTAEVDVSYRASPLSVQEGRAPARSAIHAGDHAPDAQIHPGLRLSRLLRGTGHVLLLFDGGRRDAAAFARLRYVAETIGQRYAAQLEVHLVVAGTERPAGAAEATPTLLDPHRQLHAGFGATPGSGFLVRPDGYVGYRGAPVDVLGLRRYLEGVFGER